MNSSFIIFFYLLGLGQLQRVQITPQIALYFHEILLSLMVIWNTQKLIPYYQKYLRIFIRSKFFVAFTIFGLTQLVLFQVLEPNIVSLLYIGRLFLYAHIFLLVKLALNTTPFSRKFGYWLVCGLGWMISTLGLIQYLFIPDTRFLYFSGWDEHYFRLISSLFDPNFTGLMIGIGIVVYIYQFFSTQDFLKRFTFLFPSILALVLTYSRASYLAFIATIIFIALRSRKKAVFFIILALLLSIPVLPRPASEGVKLERTASVFSRINSNQQALRSLSLTEVVIGKGIFTQQRPSENNLPNHAVTPDNSFIFLFVSFGIIGSTLLFLALSELKHVFIQQPMSSILLMVGIHSMFNNSLFYIWVMCVLWILLGLQSKKSVTA